MAISRIAGQMLNSSLQRDGVNLSFVNSNISTPALFLDVSNNRVGINSSSASYTLDVTGNIRATANILANNMSATANVVGGNLISNNVYSSSGDLNLYTVSNGNILLDPNGTGFTKAVGTNGFVIPVGNTAQRPGTPDTGTIRFNTTTVQTEVWDGSQWVSATGATSAITNQTINGDGSTLTFAMSYSATAESVLVTINGVLQTPTTAYTTNTGLLTITFTEAPAIADVIQIRYIAATTVLASLVNGTSNVSIPVSGGNINLTTAGSTSLVVTSLGTVTTGTSSTTGNITGGNVLTAGIMSSTGNVITASALNGATLNLSGNVTSTLNVTGNTVSGNVQAVTSLLSSGSVSATGNITGGNLSVNTGNISLGNIVNNNANGVGNIGNATTYFNTVFAKATSAQYADLAEFYAADAEYAPGTVLSFGGDQEVTVSTQDADPCVAGVVSTNPSYIMNAGIFCEFPTQLALTGRVPCRVIGSVTKGAMMVAAGNGAARAERTPAMGTVIGKALEAFEGVEGTIEIVVGRL